LNKAWNDGSHTETTERKFLEFTQKCSCHLSYLGVAHAVGFTFDPHRRKPLLFHARRHLDNTFAFLLFHSFRHHLFRLLADDPLFAETQASSAALRSAAVRPLADWSLPPALTGRNLEAAVEFGRMSWTAVAEAETPAEKLGQMLRVVAYIQDKVSRGLNVHWPYHWSRDMLDDWIVFFLNICN
jgi:hypothetical protein